MNTDKSAEFIDKILDAFIICPMCISRQIEINEFVVNHRSPSKKNNKKNCYICHGLLSKISYMVLSINSKIKKFDFKNWLIGIKLPTYMYDNEDVVRSKFKIRGKKNIKTDFLERLRNAIGILLKKPLVFKKPDIVINLEIYDDDSFEVFVKSRPMFVLGRYVKRISGLDQKNKICEKNNQIQNHVQYNSDSVGKIYHSIEQIIKEKLAVMYSDKKEHQIDIFWIGGEDKDSLVLGKGRPFIAEICNPKKRYRSETDKEFCTDKNYAYKKNFRKKGVCIFIDKILDALPKGKIHFVNKIRIYVQCNEPISQIDINKLKILKEKEIVTDYKSNRIIKKIYSIRTKYLDTNKFVLTIISDGGLFIKQFIGDNSSSMNTSVSEMLGRTCTCLKFDILDIDIVQMLT
ncbi:MAG: hypothetical protein DA328_09435 [Nitrososphaeraceae archaeon]|nr:hypothetical protein [Nitrososphaeraceae archaeon]